MAKTPKTSSQDDIIDAVEESEPVAQESPSKAGSETAETKTDDGSEKSFGEKFMDFVRGHPFISMIIFYLILSIFVRFWGWATILFLAIPLVCYIRIYMLTKDVGTPIAGEQHETLFWWVRAGFYASVAGLLSIIVLDQLQILNVFRG